MNWVNGEGGGNRAGGSAVTVSFLGYPNYTATVSSSSTIIIKINQGGLTW